MGNTFVKIETRSGDLHLTRQLSGRQHEVRQRTTRCCLRTVLWISRNTEVGMLRFTGKLHTVTNICFLTHTTHWNSNYPSSDIYTIRRRIFPPRQENEKHNHINTAIQTCRYSNWAFVKSSTKSGKMLSPNRGGKVKLCTSNLTPPLDKICFPIRTRHPNRNSGVLMQSSATRSAHAFYIKETITPQTHGTTRLLIRIHQSICISTIRDIVEMHTIMYTLWTEKTWFVREI